MSPCTYPGLSDGVMLLLPFTSSRLASFSVADTSAERAEHTNMAEEQPKLDGGADGGEGVEVQRAMGRRRKVAETDDDIRPWDWRAHVIEGRRAQEEGPRDLCSRKELVGGEG